MNYVLSQILYWILLLLFLWLFPTFVIKKFFSPPGSRGPQETVSTNTSSMQASKTKWSFVAMRYYALILNRTFRIWINDKYVCGIRVGGVIASPVKEIDKEWLNPEYYVDTNLDKKYMNTDFESDKFLVQDKANFRILRTDIIRVDCHLEKWGMGQVPYSGRLVIVTKNGKSVELILLGQQDLKAISRRIFSR